jgi:hypothetical protein
MEIQDVKSLSDITLPDKGFADIFRKGKKLRIPIRALTAKESVEIERKTKAPQAPRNFDKTGEKTPDGKPGMYYDFNDPVYVELVAEKKAQFVYEYACTAIDLPDVTVDYLKDHFTEGDLSIIVTAAHDLSNITTEDEVKNCYGPASSGKKKTEE